MSNTTIVSWDIFQSSGKHIIFMVEVTGETNKTDQSVTIQMAMCRSFFRDIQTYTWNLVSVSICEYTCQVSSAHPGYQRISTFTRTNSQLLSYGESNADKVFYFISLPCDTKMRKKPQTSGSIIIAGRPEAVFAVGRWLVPSE